MTFSTKQDDGEECFSFFLDEREVDMNRVCETLVFLSLVSLSLCAETLAVSKSGSGTGTVTDDQGQLICGEECVSEYNFHTVVTLTADADPESHFVAWSGDCAGSGTCILTMDSDKNVTAQFDCNEGVVRPLDGVCGLNGHGNRYERCTASVWIEECDDPDLCTAGEQHCNSGNLLVCEMQSSGAYDWSLVDCNDNNTCTEDSCDDILGCVNDPSPQFTPCGDQSDTECNGPDFCDGNGVCLENIDPAGTPCGDTTTNTPCDKPDTCDGKGACMSNYEPATTVCRDATDFCDKVDTCDGNGACSADAVKTSSDVCRPSTGVCDAAEYCDGYSKVCPPEDYTTTNGISCEDAYDYTANETCANGICTGPEVIGSCTNAYKATTFPYVLESTTVGRPSHITTYGANCPVTDAPLGDAVVHVAMDAGVTYTISIVRHGGWAGFMAIIPICSIFYTNATCLNSNSTADSFTYTPLLSGNATLVIESLSGTGDFTLTIEREETPQSDDIILPDDDAILPDEIVSDEEEPDETIFDDVATDDIFTDEEETDDVTITADDGTPLADDTVKPDYDYAYNCEADHETDKDTVVVVDNEVPDESGDELLGDEDAFLPDTMVTTDTNKTKDDGCGCSLIF